MAETRNILDFEKFSGTVRFDEWLGRDEQSHSKQFDKFQTFEQSSNIYYDFSLSFYRWNAIR